MKIVLGSRGSELARAQASLVESALRSAWPEIEVCTEIISTGGDEKGRLRYPPKAGRKGLFTREIERALLARRIDVAVHSAKDLPSAASAGLEVCAALERAPIEDVLISKTSPGLAALAAHATVATGSVRRQHQLRRLRSDLNVVDLRGNVITRLRKLTTNAWEAIILARAGLERLGFDCSSRQLVFEGHTLRTAFLPRDKFLPAAGQGIVALQARTDDHATRELLAPVNHEETFLCLRAERDFLRRLQGDCGTPVGVLATIEGRAMTLRAQVFAEGQREPRTEKVEVRPSFQHNPEGVAAALFEWMYGEKK